MARNYQVSRIKLRKKKKCMKCGRWRTMLHGPGDSNSFGVCDECRTDKYSEKDWNQQHIKE